MSESGDDGPLSPEALLARAREHWARGEPCWFDGADAHDDEVWDFAIEAMKRSGYSDARLAEALMDRGCSPPQRALGHVAQALTTLHHLTALLAADAKRRKGGRRPIDPMVDWRIWSHVMFAAARLKKTGNTKFRMLAVEDVGRSFNLSPEAVESTMRRFENKQTGGRTLKDILKRTPRR